jgi:hypothetical protein
MIGQATESVTIQAEAAIVQTESSVVITFTEH